MVQLQTVWQRLRIILIELLVGLGLGVLIWEVVGRRILAFKYGSLGSSVTCAPDVNQALAEFDSGLRFSALSGAVGFVILSFVVRMLWRRRAKRSRSTTTPPTAS